MSIAIQKINDTSFEVTVAELETTRHHVTLSEDYYQKLTAGRISKELLIEESFDFLLARETNTMILSQFDLPIIQKYFPDYEKTIKELE